MTTFSVLFICRANQYRSTIAELLLQALTDDVPPTQGTEWRPFSAGVDATPGTPVFSDAGLLLAEAGVVSDDFRSTLLTADVVASADLILTAERRHRGCVIDLVPAVRDLTFTLKQFARLVSMAEIVPAAARPLDLVVAANSCRGRAEPLDPADDDILDPAGRSLETGRATMLTIADALDAFTWAPVRRPTVTRCRGRRWWGQRI